MEASTFNSFKTVITRLDGALRQLNYTPSHHQLEKWAMLILESMSGPYRLFHRPHHILFLSDNLDPIGTLSALYHDIVYYHVDGGVCPAIYSVISSYFYVVNGVLYVADFDKSDLLFDLALEVFGFKRGQKLIVNAGQNEFLSTLVALRELEQVLSLADLLMIAVCIESTIPFRAKEHIYVTIKKRIEKLNKKLKLGLAPQQIIDAITRAVILANKDVENFSYKDVSKFLENTWLILPEANKKLIENNFYTIKEYRLTIQNMESFLGQLDARRIYHQYHNVPSDEVFHQQLVQTDFNLHIAKVYLRIRLYETAILEALAELTGGDVPLIYFIGDVNTKTDSPKHIENYLKHLPQKVHADHNPIVLSLLEKGRASSVSFDTNNSPLAAYLYNNLGEKIILENAKDALRFFYGEISAQNFLRIQNHALVIDIAQAASQLVWTRYEALQNFSEVLAQ